MASAESESIHVGDEMDKNAGETTMEHENQVTVLTLESILMKVVIILFFKMKEFSQNDVDRCSFLSHLLLYVFFMYT